MKNENVEFEKIFSSFKQLSDKAISEIDNVRKVYIWLSGLMTIIIAAGLFFSYKSLSDFKSELHENVDSIVGLEKEKNAVELRKIELERDRLLFELQQRMNDKIVEEFDKNKVESLIQHLAYDKIEGYIDTTLEYQIEDNINPKLYSLELNIDKSKENLEKLVFESKRELSKLLEESNLYSDTLALSLNFSNMFLAAFTGHRESWDGLKRMADDTLSWNSYFANRAFIVVKDYYSELISNDYIFVTDYNGVPAIDSIGDNVELLLQIYLAHHQKIGDNYPAIMSLIKSVAKSKVVSLKSKSLFLLTVMKIDYDLRTVAYAGNGYAKLHKLAIKGLAIEYFEKHYGENYK